MWGKFTSLSEWSEIIWNYHEYLIERGNQNHSTF